MSTPGERIVASERDITNLRREIEELRLNVDAAGKRITSLERFRAWLLGAAGAIGLVFGLLGDAIKARLGMGGP